TVVNININEVAFDPHFKSLPVPIDKAVDYCAEALKTLRDYNYSGELPGIVLYFDAAPNNLSGITWAD
ncbi:MAG: hypothetical protein IKO06_03665, partial [Alphaproteobacteria bacterium]|nr:hypothetical protein [Alphaproteobacteria bacterium]